MATYHGISPQPATIAAVKQFENEMMIRLLNRFLVATVYLDIEITRWAVAIAYNPSRRPGIFGHDNLLEVRYSYALNKRMTMTMMRSDPMEETVIATGPFPDPDTFIRHVLSYERELVNRSG